MNFLKPQSIPKRYRFPTFPCRSTLSVPPGHGGQGTSHIPCFLQCMVCFVPPFIVQPSLSIGQPPFIEDCAAFLVIVFSARKWGLVYAAGLPTLIGNIVRGGTAYFLVIFAGELLLIFFNLLPPVSDLPIDSFSSTRLIMAAHRDRSIRSQERKSSPSNISINMAKADHFLSRA